MNKILYFLQDMWMCDWKPAVKLSLLWLVTSFVVEDAVHGWYDIDWLVVIVGFVFIFVLRLIVPSFYHLFEGEDDEHI